MSQQPLDMRETLSALVDGEASDLELRRILRERNEGSDGSDLRDRWDSYQKISAALRRNEYQGVDISSAVMEAVLQEPPAGTIRQWGRAVRQTAIAASVAGVALLGVQQYQIAQNQMSGSSSVAEASRATQAFPVEQPPSGFEFQPVTRAVSSSEQVLTQGTQIQIPVDRDQMMAHLDELVREHSEKAVRANQSLLPVVRVPASESEQ